MTDLWPVHEGREPTLGEPWLSLPLDQAIALLELRPRHFVSDLNQTPRFGPENRDLSIFGYKHVIAEVYPSEARLPDWKAGFYRSPLAPKKVVNRILRYTLAPYLGEANVLRVEHNYATDSKGRVTARVTVVLNPEALQYITGEITLSAVGRLQNLLTTMGVEGTPILQYATEDELAHND